MGQGGLELSYSADGGAEPLASVKKCRICILLVNLDIWRKFDVTPRK